MYLNKDGTSIYDHMNSEPVQVPINMDALAALIEDSNAGTIRFLAALYRIRKAKLAKRIAEYTERGDHDIARSVTARGDKIAEVIELALAQDDY
jgi:hypothetical protein